MKQNEKLEFDLLPVEFDDLALVAMNGAKKYAPHGWEEEGIDSDKNYASIRRHINDYRQGNRIDAESKLHPLLHAAFRCLMQYTLDKRRLARYYETHPIPFGDVMISLDEKKVSPINTEHTPNISKGHFETEGGILIKGTSAIIGDK